ncbi:MAG TPA: hypothetical protein VIZ86_16765 [Pseudomonas sp.]
MTGKISTGLVGQLLTTAGLKEALTGVHLYVYAGAEPATADAALGGATLLCDYSGNGDGSALLLAASAVGGQIEKDAAQVWQGTAVANGTAAFFRFAMPADTGEYSTTAIRVQGVVGNVGKELNLNDLDFTTAAVMTITDWFFAQPTA